MDESGSTVHSQQVDRPTYARKLYRLAKKVLLAYLAICLLMMLIERFLVYHPPQLLNNVTEIEQLGGEEISVEAEDGTQIFGWYFAHQNPRRGILYSYGNGEDAARNAEYMAYLRDQLQASVLVFDYRGYGKSAGKPFEDGLILDGSAAQRWLADQLRLKPDDIVLFGRSLGGGVAVALAERQGAQALIVHSSFANMVDVGAAAYPWLPVRLMMRNRFESEERIKNYDGPLLQIHGTADYVVPFDLATPLYEAAPTEQKVFLEVPNGGHNDGLSAENLQAIVEFLDSAQ